MAIYKRNFKDRKTGKTVESENWTISYYFEGRQIRETIGSNKQMAKDALKARQGEIAQDRYSLKQSRKSLLFDDFAKIYLEYSKTNKRSYERDVSIFKALFSFFNGYRLDKITPFLVEKYKITRSKTTSKAYKRLISKSTINRELDTLRSMLSMAVRDGEIESNSAKEVKWFKVDNKKERILNQEEIQMLLAECNGHVKSITLLALNTAMRLREILNLKLINVDFSRNVIKVVDTKSSKNRNVPMNDLVVNTLGHAKENAIKIKSEYCFSNPKTGQPYHDIKTGFCNALQRAGLVGVRFHDLRHTACSAMVANGADLVTVKEILGHADLSMVLRYSHPTTDDKIKAVTILEEQTVEKVSTIQAQQEKQGLA